MTSNQLGLFADIEPEVDATFSRAERRHLDETSWVEIVSAWLTGGEVLLGRVIAASPFEQRRRWMYNELVEEPRLTAEYRDLSSVPDPFLLVLTRVLSRHYRVGYDGLWMNLYRNERDSTAWHGDSVTCKREECIVPVLSLGATRRFLFKPRGGGASVALDPNDGDLIVMGGRCQLDWLHSVPKRVRPVGVRVSINFSSSAQARKG